MATLICNGTGNLTGSTTFAAAEIGALANVLNRNTIELLAAAATVTSVTFTVTSAKVIDAVLLWIRLNDVAPTGTFKVDLQKGGVSQASVIVNKADLPPFCATGNNIGNLVPVLFKLSSTATGDGGANWTVVLTTTGTIAVNYAGATASTTNFTRALRTTTAATPAAADDLYIIGELTGAGTHTSRTVTMDQTATTAYGSGLVNSTTVAGGGIHCGYYGALTYGTAAATNYVLRVNGDVWVWEQGPLTIGASGSEIPRGSTAVLELQMTSAAGDFGLRIMENAVFNSAGLSRTIGKVFNKCKLNANLAAAGTTLNVDTDTGWLSGDVVCVASTTRTNTDSETLTLTGNAGASSMTTGAAVNAHSGTSQTQAEVGLLTRNAIIRSTSNTNVTYLYCTALSTINMSWTEIYNIGVNAVKARGIEIDGNSAVTANAKSITYCSIHDTPIGGLFCNGNLSSMNLTFSNNVLWNLGTGFSPGVTTSGTNWTLDNNLFVKGGQVGYQLSSVQGTFTNNTAVSMGTHGIVLGDSPAFGARIGTFTGNVAHSCGQFGLNVTGQCFGTIGYTGWRNNLSGLSISGNIEDIIWNNLTLFGNGSINLSLNGSGTLNITGNSVIAGDTTFSTTNGISVAAGITLLVMNLSNLDMSGIGGIYAPHTTDVNTAAGNSRVNFQVTALNCKFGALTFGTTTNTSKQNWANGSFWAFEKYNQTSGDHRTEMAYGQLKIDTTIFNIAPQTMRMTPNNASNKLASASRYNGIQVAVASGATVNFAAYVRKSASGDGAAYNGNQPRLILRANPAIGITSDTVLATMSASTGTWQQLSGTTASATDNGVMEFIVDCDGTAGWINVGDWQAT